MRTRCISRKAELCVRATGEVARRYTSASVKKYAIYGVGAVLLMGGLSERFARQCVSEMVAQGKVVKMVEEI